MHPWKISAGLTLALLGPLAILLPRRFAYLAPYTALLWQEHGIEIMTHAGVAVAGVAALVYWLARKAGLFDLGARLAHVDRGLREGEAYDPALGTAIRRDREGHWE